MRIATTILVFTAIVCASQVEASWIDSAKDSVESLGKAVSDNLNKATDALRDSLNKVKGQTEEATDKLAEATEKVSDVEEAVDAVQKSTDKQVNELTEEAEAEGVDVSECREVVKSVRKAASTVVKDTVSCVNNTLRSTKDAVVYVVTLARDTVNEIKELRRRAEECSNSTEEGIIARVTATTCLTTVNTKTVWVVSTGVPSIIKNIATTTKQIVTLPSTLRSCLSKTGVEALTEQSRVVVDDVKECIAEKTGRPIEKKPEPIVEEEEVREAVVANNNPLNWLKSKIF